MFLDMVFNAIVVMIAVTACGVAGRVRGGWPLGRGKVPVYVSMAGAGAIFALLVTDNWWLVLASAVLMPLLSFRWDTGWRGRFVSENFVTDAEFETRWLHAIRQGITIPLPLLPLAYWDMSFLWMIPAFQIGVVGGAALSMELPALKFMDFKHEHPWMEFLELFIAAFVLAVMEWLS